MNFRYYKSSLKYDELFVISSADTNKLFIMNGNGSIAAVDMHKEFRKKLIEIEEYEYMFNETHRNYLLDKINLYLKNADMTYRKKTLNKLLEDIDELNKYNKFTGGE